MTTKSTQSATLPKKRIIKTACKKNGVVDAVVIGPPNLSLYLKLQNLLNYFIDCMNSLTSLSADHQIWSDHFNRCIQFISELESSDEAQFDEELNSMLQEFLVDAENFRELLFSINEPTLTRTKDQTAAVLLTAKASHLQWLSVCILEDLKKNYTHS
jgi:hypothetical protein